MIQYERIDVSERIDLNKTSASEECMICNYWYFLDIGYKYEPHVCNKCHDISIMAYELENITIYLVLFAIFLIMRISISSVFIYSH